MAPAVVSFHEQRILKLISDLEKVRQRGVDRVFQRADKTGPLEFDVLDKVLESSYPELWKNSATQVEAIEKIFRDSVDSLPQALIPNVVPPKSPDVPPMTYRRAALILFKLRIPEALLDRIKQRYNERQEYARLARYVRDESGYPEDKDGFEQDVTAKVKRKMAEFMLKGEPNNEPGDAEDVRDEVTAESLNERNPEQHSRQAFSKDPSKVVNAEKITQSIVQSDHPVMIIHNGRDE